MTITLGLLYQIVSHDRHQRNPKDKIYINHFSKIPILLGFPHELIIRRYKYDTVTKKNTWKVQLQHVSNTSEIDPAPWSRGLGHAALNSY